MYDLGNNFSDYKEEITLSIKQNGCVEMELNSIIVQLLRSRQRARMFSYRDVTTRRETKVTKKLKLKGKSGFPDFVVFHRQNNVILGCIELKAIHSKIEDKTKQVKGHIESFNRVLYSNGLAFHYYNGSQLNSITIGEYKKDKINWCNESEWIKLLDFLDNLWIGELDEKL